MLKSYWTLPSFLISCLLILATPFCSIENKNNTSTNPQKQERKQKGIHIFGTVDSLTFPPLVKNNLEWVTYVPWGDQKDFDSPRVASGITRDSSSLMRRDSLWQTRISLAHDAGLKVFIKPHIWIFEPSDGKWRSDIFPSNEENWETWNTSYRAFILHHARMAEKYKAEMFCVGTEFTRLVLEKPEFWKQLIAEVRNIYSGKLTYAANWYEEFESITFWDELDYIGIQAYFPLVKNKNPSVKEISKGWQKHLPIIKRIHRKFNKQILFTELGYKSTEDSAIEPWTWLDYETDFDKIPVSTETQMNCYQAFFNTVWKEDWMGGVHLWSWNPESKGGLNNLDFTPRNKPVEKVIAKEFGDK